MRVSPLHIAWLLLVAMQMTGQILPFRKTAEVAVGVRLTGPISVAAADVNSDGYPDLVIADLDGKAVQIALASADGGFSAGHNIALGTAIRQVAVADFDGDGNVDIAAASSERGALLLMMGRGDGTFQETRRTSLPQPAIAILAADVNGDGFSDLVIGQTDGVWIALGEGDGSFAEGKLTALEVVPVAIRSGDFNGDGISDLAIAGTGKPDSPLTSEIARIYVLLGTDDSGLREVPAIALGRGRASDFTVADFDQDGNADIAIADRYNSQYWVTLGRGDGTFGSLNAVGLAEAPLSIGTGDFNGDGFPDLVSGNYYGGSIAILLGRGNGTFERGTDVISKGDNFGIAVVDLNGDGVLDIVAANHSSRSVTVAWGRGDAVFESPLTLGSSPSWIVAMPRDASGMAALAVVNTYSDSVVVLRDSLQVADTYRVGQEPRRAVAGDFNGDGIADLAVLNSYSRDVSILLGDGDGRYQPAATVALPAAPIAIAAADWSGDGMADLIVSVIGESGGLLLLSKGNGEFTDATAVTGMSGASYIAKADFNGDGLADLAVTASSAPPAVRVLLAKAGGTFQAGPTLFFAADGFATAILSVDVNDDGRADLVVNLGLSGAVLLGKGDGSFETPKIFEGPAPGTGAYGAMAAADFDGDGRVDLAVVSSRGVLFFPGNGDGTFRTEGAASVRSLPVFLVPLPRDDGTDLAGAELDNGTVAIYRRAP